MLIYKGRTLNVDDSLIKEYRDTRGRELNQRDLDLYVHASYIKKVPDPEEYVKTNVSDEELADIFTHKIKTDIYLHS